MTSGSRERVRRSWRTRDDAAIQANRHTTQETDCCVERRQRESRHFGITAAATVGEESKMETAERVTRFVPTRLETSGRGGDNTETDVPVAYLVSRRFLLWRQISAIIPGYCSSTCVFCFGDCSVPFIHLYPFACIFLPSLVFLVFSSFLTHSFLHMLH